MIKFISLILLIPFLMGSSLWITDVPEAVRIGDEFTVKLILVLDDGVVDRRAHAFGDSKITFVGNRISTGVAANRITSEYGAYTFNNGTGAIESLTTSALQALIDAGTVYTLNEVTFYAVELGVGEITPMYDLDQAAIDSNKQITRSVIFNNIQIEIVPNQVTR